MIICKKEKCTACYACFNVCKKNAISFQKDDLGCLYPAIDESKCVECGLCKKVCPNNNERNFVLPLKCYASYTVDNLKRKMSASGGIGNSFAEFIINKGGYFYGAKYSDDFEVLFEETQNVTDLEKYKGSKYVHSHIQDSFTKIKQRLGEGQQVVVIALPCQIAGLKFFLQDEYDNLTTVDLICHGVSPANYLQNEISYLSCRIHTKVKTCIFRNNAGLNFCFVLVNSDKTIVYKKGAYFNPYFRGFLTGVTLRENCYHCDYARKERISDITIGDFIGLGKDTPFDGDASNASVVIVNTKKGQAFFNDCIKENQNLVSKERSYDEAVKYSPSLKGSFKKHPLCEPFRQKYKKYGFSTAARKTLWAEFFKEVVKRFVYMVVHFYKVYKLPSKIKMRLKK